MNFEQNYSDLNNIYLNLIRPAEATFHNISMFLCTQSELSGFTQYAKHPRDHSVFLFALLEHAKLIKIYFSCTFLQTFMQDFLIKLKRSNNSGQQPEPANIS